MRLHVIVFAQDTKSIHLYSTIELNMPHVIWCSPENRQRIDRPHNEYKFTWRALASMLCGQSIRYWFSCEHQRMRRCVGFDPLAHLNARANRILCECAIVLPALDMISIHTSGLGLVKGQVWSRHRQSNIFWYLTVTALYDSINLSLSV